MRAHCDGTGIALVLYTPCRVVHVAQRCCCIVTVVPTVVLALMLSRSVPRCGLLDALGRGAEERGLARSPYAALRVGNLRRDVDEEALYEFFSQVGPVESARVVRDTRTCRVHRGGALRAPC